MKKRLQAIVTPEKTVILEFLDEKTAVSPQISRFETKIFDFFDKNDDFWLLLLAFSQTNDFSPSIQFFHDFLSEFAREILRCPEFDTDAMKRVNCDRNRVQQALLNRPPFPGSEYCDAEMLFDLWHTVESTFWFKMIDFPSSTADFVHFLSPKIEIPGHVYFHLVENKGKEAPFAFLATYSTAEDPKTAAKHLPLQHALEAYRNDNEKLLHLLSSVYKAAKNSELITDLIESGDIFYPLEFNTREAYTFLKEVLDYEKSGVLCRIPDWWRPKTQKASVSVSIGTKKPAKVGLQALLDASPSLTINGIEMTIEEAQRLLAESEGLTLIKNKWVAVDPDKIKQALAAYEQLSPMLEAGMTLADAMRMQMKLSSSKHPENELVEVTSGDWLKHVMHTMRAPAETARTAPPADDFSARLRPYQQHGLNWLHLLYQFGFGGCLADDMGLGKTIQFLAFMSLIRHESDLPSLLILPASLLANWKQEINRFLPDLKTCFAHPSMRTKGQPKSLSTDTAARYDLVVTTYALAQRYEWISQLHWNCVVLDEAQAIKNPATKQTRAVKKLNARLRFALTGTPLENKLADLWSLFDFLNPGLLGSATEFKTYAKTLADHPETYGRLREVISPFILRRRKTDKSIISDLPDKVELKTYSELSKQQIVHYRHLLTELEKSLENADGMERRGLILSILMKCKQLCNHPAQYLGSNDYNAIHSGKFSRLREICETIYEKRERALVFTQFKEITQPLHDYLETVFEHPGRVLHGSVAVKKRQQLVAEFQDPHHYVPFMVLSIKAGGVGLNLTQANHVIHFDRWWNPAVENQATDRAFRIGQQKDVLVHKFIMRGTIEERIDEMLEEKKALFENIVEANTTTDLTEMSNQELLDMFALRL